MADACERLEGDHLAGLDEDDRLVGDLDQPTGDREPHQLAIRGLGSARRILGRKGDRAALRAFRAVHRDVGCGDQARGRIALAGARHADRGRDRGHPVAQGERRRDRLDDARGDRPCVRRVDETRAEHDELVAAEPAGAIGRAEHAVDPLGDDHEGLVACGVSQRVVDVLEAVQIDEEQAQLAVVEGVADELVHQPAVRQTGECIVQRPERDLTLAAAAGGSIAERALEDSRPELVPPDTAVGTVLERRPRDRLRGVVDDHDDGDLGDAGPQAGERGEGDLRIGSGREHEALVRAPPRPLDALRDRLHGVEPDARIACEQLEIEPRENGIGVGHHEGAKRTARRRPNGLLVSGRSSRGHPS